MDTTPDIAPKDTPLHAHIKTCAERYYQMLDGEEPHEVYALFLEQMERPLLEVTLRHTRGNQSRTAQILGLNRGTLRTKMKKYGLL